jgi:PP-loop superfamily ATP-utilizing enzyme
MQTVREKLDHLGFEHVTLDMAGFSSGSMDKGVMKL